MDPTNNPTPTPTPEPGAAPAPEPSVSSAPADAPTPEPVNPVINPGGGGAPVNPVFQPGESNGLSATDPIMQPEAPKEPDPVEEELKAPMKAAGPVPGSIGSAVSGPQAEGEPDPLPADNPFADSGAPAKTPNVPFNDPAVEAQGAAAAPVAAAKPSKNKTALIILCVVAGLVVVALAIVLFLQLSGNNNQSNSGSSSSDNGGNSEVVIDDEDEGDDEEGNGGGDSGPIAAESGTMTCTKEIEAGTASKENESATGTSTVTVEFADKTLTTISLKNTVDGDDSATEEHKATASELTVDSALVYGLATEDSDGELDLSIDAVKTNYENLDFVCEVL